jgi:hypothetical protein
MVGEVRAGDSGLGARGPPTWHALMGALGSAGDRPEVRQQRRAGAPGGVGGRAAGGTAEARR